MQVMKEWYIALDAEVKELKSRGGTGYTIVNGAFLYRDSKASIYTFQLTIELFFPSDTPVRVEIGGESVNGEILGTEGFEIEIKLNTYIGETVKEAKLFSEPWQLLEELGDRLSEVEQAPERLKRVQRVMTGTVPVRHAEKMNGPHFELIYRSYYNDVTYVWGPPGTGKTYHLSRVVAQHAKKEKSVLVLAHSNAAVDVLMLEVARLLTARGEWRDGEVIRYGYSQDEAVQSHPSLLAAKMADPGLQSEQEELLARRHDLKSRVSLTKQDERELSELRKAARKLRLELKEQEEKQAERAKVIGATLTKCAIDPALYQRTYDLVVVDEVSMAYVPQIAFAASLGKRVVVCGDFKQLPPIAMSRHPLVEKWLREDVFHHVGIASKLSHPHLYMLKEQRRMHPDISSFTNSFIYEGKVSDHESVHARNEIAAKGPFPGKATLLLDTQDMGAHSLTDAASRSRYNIVSGLMSLHLAVQYAKRGLSVGIVTPYKAQARFLSICARKLQATGVTIATVHRFQGAERDVMIFDVVDSEPQERPGVLFFNKNSQRLINVAVTRARGKFIQIADVAYTKAQLANRLAFSQLTMHLKRQGSLTRNRDFLQEVANKKLRWFPGESPYLYKDIRSAKESILISAPQDMSKRLRSELKHAGVSVKICKAPTFLVLIDNTILWTGAETTVRLRSPETVTLLKSYLTGR
ncbi:AAA domain-containing protein [Ectobacillus sp. JY-23]|uniref:AAA domain-containing protein n=1 Tax=Ectobacillus sp. JY-23 TaxID=2933872 RepID=UPI001FF504ED|nr:AAA domain-containing protein [Ectobacillus sp. JY-23]UOY92551.1 AAA domain-containing protein [Ectobacillus sp. JY-23]